VELKTDHGRSYNGSAFCNAMKQERIIDNKKIDIS
jgi:hypothetical protein